MGDDMINLALGGDALDGLAMNFPVGKGMGEGNMPSHLQDDDVERGSLGVKLRGEWSVHHRFCVYWRHGATLKVFKNADDSLCVKALSIPSPHTKPSPHACCHCSCLLAQPRARRGDPRGDRRAHARAQ